VSAGDVAGEGAKIAALSARERAEADAILRKVEYVDSQGARTSTNCSSTNWHFRDETHFDSADFATFGGDPAAMKRVAVIACGALALDVRAIARRRGWEVDLYPVPATLHNRPEQIPDAVAAELARDEVRSAMEEQPGTYLLTDFLARTFEHTIVRELGLDRHPELLSDYFGNYTRVLWLAQRPTPDNLAAAERAAAWIGLPLEVRVVGNVGLERALERLVEPLAPAAV
jgi:hypothetical protein